MRYSILRVFANYILARYPSMSFSNETKTFKYPQLNIQTKSCTNETRLYRYTPVTKLEILHAHTPALINIKEFRGGNEVSPACEQTMFAMTVLH